jgi:pimeloyl-ACP methyl ester carboxylesterase/class 3 adenylate cyclase
VPAGIYTNLEWQWEEPSFERFLRGLASFSRLIVWDPRGTGLSDKAPELPILEEQMDDLTAVLDAAGSTSAVVVGVSQGGPMAMLFAATYPGRVAGLVLYGTYATAVREEDYPWGRSREWIEEFLRQTDEDWGTGSFAAQLAPTAAADPGFRDWWSRFERFASAPANALAYIRMNVRTDVRHILQAITVPTLVLQRRDDTYRNPAQAAYLADRIDGARLVELPGIDHLPFVGPADAVLDEIEAFVTGVRPARSTGRSLATVLFTDIVDSTARAVALGDRRWRELLAEHDAAIRAELARFRGRELDTTGDGFVAAFDGPARAVQCAGAAMEAVRGLGVELRAGVHTGELELDAAEVHGLALHIAARVMSQAGPGEIVVSGTVHDLVVGSELAFEDRGMHVLKGIPGEWRLYAVTSPA